MHHKICTSLNSEGGVTLAVRTVGVFDDRSNGRPDGRSNGRQKHQLLGRSFGPPV